MKKSLGQEKKSRVGKNLCEQTFWQEKMYVEESWAGKNPKLEKKKSWAGKILCEKKKFWTGKKCMLKSLQWEKFLFEKKNHRHGSILC